MSRYGFLIPAAFALFLFAYLSKGDSSKTFTFKQEKAVDGTLLINAMVPPQIGVEVISGPPLEKKEVLNCVPLSKKLDVQVKPGIVNVVPSALLLECKDRTLLVKGLTFP